MIKDDSEKNELSYTIEKKTIQAVTSNGIVFAEYNLEYPVFKGETEGEKEVNRLFAELVNNYTLHTKDADVNYKRFIRGGGDKNKLPCVTHAVARVTYNKNGYISIVEGLSSYNPLTNKLSQAEQDEVVILPERDVEGYIIDVETGNCCCRI